MNYEEKYNEALTYVKNLVEHNVISAENASKCFPELAESEDERMMKALTTYFQSFPYQSLTSVGVNAKDVVAWLEKQGEQNLTNSAKICKIKPKFKVGDWITNGCLHYKIIDVLENHYIVDTGFAKRKVIPIRQEKYYHLWTIRDAKDGDVLVDTNSDKMIIFHKIGNGRWNDVIDYYVAAKDGYFNIPKGAEYWSSIHACKLKPTTAVQRDLLFEQIGKAGYIWDDHAKMLICSTDKKSK